jgi:uncharacterized protein (DUF58 family)
MRLHPTIATFHVALAGTLMIAVGVIGKIVPAVACGGGMLLAMAFGRSLARMSVTQIRTAGFEMVWVTSRRSTRVGRFDEVVLEAELRNRSAADARGVNVRALASSLLDVSISPEILDLPRASNVRFEVRIRAPRVGLWGVHGIALEVRGAQLGGEGLFEVPLMFANPHGIEVIPKPFSVLLQSARGGRARHTASASEAGARKGDGDQLRELRDHAPGDPWKRIAWKASARKGKLLVREMEHAQRDVVWLVLDASVELWAGRVGTAPLDEAIDELASIASRHLASGDSVGLAVYASRRLAWLPANRGLPHAVALSRALTSAASMVDVDRCELDEAELARRVAEHIRPLDNRGLTDLTRGNVDSLAERAEAMRAQAPLSPPLPEATTPREQRFRHYLAAFGIEVPPRVAGERDKACVTLRAIVEQLANERASVRPSVVHVWAPPPPESVEMRAALAKLRARRIEVRWSLPAFEGSLAPERPTHEASVESVIFEAVRRRQLASRAHAERSLQRLGIRTRTIHARRRHCVIEDAT